MQETDQGAEAIRAVLGNLRAITTKLAEIRNPFGSGHGKSASFQGLETRHAKLAVGSSITFVDFIWSTYENQKKRYNDNITQTATICRCFSPELLTARKCINLTFEYE